MQVMSNERSSFAANCPSRKILLTLTSRWSVLILVALRDQRLRFNELKN